MSVWRQIHQAFKRSAAVHDCVILRSRTLPEAHTATRGVETVTPGTAVASAAKASTSAFVTDPLLRRLIMPTKDTAEAGERSAPTRSILGVLLRGHQPPSRLTAGHRSSGSKRSSDARTTGSIARTRQASNPAVMRARARSPLPRSTSPQDDSTKASQNRRDGSAIRQRLSLDAVTIDSGWSAAITRLSCRSFRLLVKATCVMPVMAR